MQIQVRLHVVTILCCATSLLVAAPALTFPPAEVSLGEAGWAGAE